MASLLTLPTEIVEMIFGHLVLPGGHTHSRRRDRAALHRLLLVSKNFKLRLEPFCYRSLTHYDLYIDPWTVDDLWNENETYGLPHPYPWLLLFFRSLLNRPALGELVREIHILEVSGFSDRGDRGTHDEYLITYFTAEQTQRAKSLMSEKFQALRGDTHLPPYRDYWIKKLTWSCPNVISSLILSALPNLPSLNIRLWYGDIQQMLPLCPLQGLRKLDLACQGLEESASNNLSSPEGQETMPQNQYLHSAFSILQYLLSITMPLRSLCYAEYASSNLDRPVFKVQEYRDLISIHKDTLENLSLVLTTYHGHYWYAPFEATNLDGFAFGSMHDFTSLSKLYIQLEVLLGDRRYGEGHRQLADVLPSQLVHFSCFSVQPLFEAYSEEPGIWDDRAHEQFVGLEKAVCGHPERYALSSVSMHCSRKDQFPILGESTEMPIDSSSSIKYTFY